MRDRLVVGSVTTSEYLLLIVLSFSTPVRYLALLTFTRRSNEIYIVLEAPELSRPNPEPTCLKILPVDQKCVTEAIMISKSD